MTPCLVALDQGTSSSRAVVFDVRGRRLASARRSLSVAYPQPGWVEQDALEIWHSQRDALAEALAFAAADVAAIGIANQRETTVVWERATGQPIAPAIVWQDRRTAARCRELADGRLPATIAERTGLRLDPYFSATKIGWILDHVAGARARAERGELAFGTVDCWLIWNLTGGRVHATDVTNAARTMLFDIRRRDWDDELLAAFDVPRALLPEVRPSAAHFGTAKLDDRRIDVVGVAGDQPAALLGQQCVHAGEAKNTYGTGSFVLMHTGTELRRGMGLIAGPVCSLPGAAPAYGLEGSIFVAGALVQWLRDGLGIIQQSADVEALARRVPDSGGVTIVPAFAGLGAPFWDPDARGTILGLTRGSTAAHLARAALEAIAFRTCDVVAAMEAALGAPMTRLRVDGGAAEDDLLLEIQADLLGVTVERPVNTETTVLGAAMLAAVGSGSVDAATLGSWWQRRDEFAPRLDAASRRRRQRHWRLACDRARGWAAADDP